MHRIGTNSSDHDPSPDRRPPRRAASAGGGRRLAAALATLVVLAAGPASAQMRTAFWGWGQTTPAWSPEHLADYLFTGHAPHPAVARIIAPESAGTSMGSGVLVDVNQTQGLVLTNWHVVRDSRSAVLVQFADGFQSAGTVVRWDEAWDLAAVVIWKPAVAPISIATAPPAIGERLTIAGFGRGVYREESGECTEYLSPGAGYGKEFVELRATARQGDSGGPIFNARRELAGVLFGQNEGRTIGSCSTRVRTFLAGLGSRGFTPTPLAEFSDAPAAERGVTTVPGPQQIAVAPLDGSIHRSTHVAAPIAPAAAILPPAPPQQATATGQPAVVRLAGVDLPAWVPDPRAHGSDYLSAAGGAALIVLGTRTVFRRRTVTATSGSASRWPS